MRFPKRPQTLDADAKTQVFHLGALGCFLCCWRSIADGASPSISSQSIANTSVFIDAVEMAVDLLDVIPIAVITTDMQGLILSTNRTLHVMLGYAPNELVGLSIERLIPDRVKRAHPGMRAGFMLKPKERKIGKGRDLTARHKDGSEVQTEVSVRIAETEIGPTVVCCLIENSARRKSIEATEEVAFFAKHNPAPVLRVDQTGVVTSANPVSVQLLGEKCASGTKLRDALSCFKEQDVGCCLETGNSVIREMQLKSLCYQFTMVAIPESGVVNVYGSDVTKLTEAKKKLNHLVRHDDLTQLPNRKHFSESLQDALLRCNRSNVPVLLMYIDLDGFKKVNDTFGHDVGDLVLKESARRLQQCIRQTDSVFRLGGDEFGIILEHSNHEHTIVAERVCRRFDAPFSFPNREPIEVGVSIGIARSKGGESEQDFINRADAMMYAAKKTTQNSSCYQI